MNESHISRQGVNKSLVYGISRLSTDGIKFHAWCIPTKQLHCALIVV